MPLQVLQAGKGALTYRADVWSRLVGLWGSNFGRRHAFQGVFRRCVIVKASQQRATGNRRCDEAQARVPFHLHPIPAHREGGGFVCGGGGMGMGKLLGHLGTTLTTVICACPIGSARGWQDCGIRHCGSGRQRRPSIIQGHGNFQTCLPRRSDVLSGWRLQSSWFFV